MGKTLNLLKVIPISFTTPITNWIAPPRLLCPIRCLSNCLRRHRKEKFILLSNKTCCSAHQACNHKKPLSSSEGLTSPKRIHKMKKKKNQTKMLCPKNGSGSILIISSSLLLLKQTKTSPNLFVNPFVETSTNSNSQNSISFNRLFSFLSKTQWKDSTKVTAACRICSVSWSLMRRTRRKVYGEDCSWQRSSLKNSGSKFYWLSISHASWSTLSDPRPFCSVVEMANCWKEHSSNDLLFIHIWCFHLAILKF